MRRVVRALLWLFPARFRREFVVESVEVVFRGVCESCAAETIDA